MAVPPVNVLSLCAGVGGLDLGIRLACPAARTVCYVEREAHVAAVLVARMADAALDEAPVWSDLATFDGRPWRGVVDLVAAGFPCQPVSVAGRRKAQDDARWLWPDIARVLRDARPGAAFLENVPGLLTAGIDVVLGTLAELGFDAEWGVFSAQGVGAPHIRKRVFVLAVADGGGRRALLGRLVAGGRAQPDPRGEVVADAAGARPQVVLRKRGDPREELAAADRAGDPVFPPARDDYAGWVEWLDRFPGTEPVVRRGADGLAHRVDRIRAGGNGVVPLVAADALRALAARFG